MLANSINYLVEFTQSNIKQIFNNPLNYIGQIVTKVQGSNKAVYLDFTNTQTHEIISFKLHQIRSLPKVAYSYADGKQPRIDTRLQMKCVAVTQNKNPKFQRQILDILQDQSDYYSVEESDEQQEKFVGWRSMDQGRDNQIRKMILNIMNNTKNENITPSQIKTLLFKQGVYPVESFIKQYMQEISQPSNQKRRKYVLLQKYKQLKNTKKQNK